jgi:thymidylate synthase (FAD)
MLDEYKIKMLAIQYKMLGFTNKQIADTFNRYGLVTPSRKKPYSSVAVSEMTKGINNRSGNYSKPKKEVNMSKIYHEGNGSAKLIDFMGSDKRVVDAARVSFLKDDHAESQLTDRDKKLIKFLAAHNHTSPFEHCLATFVLKVPLFVRSQIMRHRTFSYNEVSRRYTSEQIDFWRPDTMRGQAKDNLQCSEGTVESSEADSIFKIATEFSFASYQQLIEAGVSREIARGVLPQSTYTTFYMTGNLHNWIKFIKLRDHEHAQPETRDIAQQIKRALEVCFPNSMNAYFGGDHE